jgi:hypothetical protein
MKSFHLRRSRITSFAFFPLPIIYNKRKKLRYLFFCFALISLTGCFHSFYKTNTKTSIDANTVSKFSSENKYFIIHSLNGTNGLENVSVKDDSIFGKPVFLPAEHSMYLHPQVNDKEVRVKVQDKENVLKEIHLYTNMILPDSDSVFAASLSSFYRTDVYEFNKGATNANHIMSVVGVTLASAVLFMAITLDDVPSF